MRHDEILPQRAVLPATFDHVAGLRVEVGIDKVFNLEFADAASFVDPRAASAQGLVQREERAVSTRGRPVQQVNRKVPVQIGFRDAVCLAKRE